MGVSRRSVLKIGVGATASLLAPEALGSAIASAATLAAPLRFPGDPGPRRLYYGAATDLDLLSWEARLGQRLSLHRSFHTPEATQQLIDTVRDDMRYDRLPHLSIKAPGTWAEVGAGRQDVWLRSLARRLSSFGRPVLITFHHEPENDSGQPGYMPADFVAMQSRIISIFDVVAPMVTVVPIYQGWSFDTLNNPGVDMTPWRVPSARILGVDSYNPFSSVNPNWIPFSQRVGAFCAWAGSTPVALGEYGCREDPAVPGRAAQWMRDAFSFAQANNIVAMSYFNSANARFGTWHLDGGRERVFVNKLASSAVARI